jgi:toxin ParE1/3/4
MRLEFSPESQLDLIEIATFIAQDNPARAKSFVDELEADCGRLITQAGIGAPRPELGDGVRVLPHPLARPAAHCWNPTHGHFLAKESTALLD